MSSFVFSLILPLSVLITISFLIIRLGYFKERDLSGRFVFLAGGIILFSVSLWQSLKSLSAYQDWFLEGAYLYIDVAQLVLFLTGLFLVIVGLSFYADFWQTKRSEIENHKQKLSILTNLQRDARDPYHLLELLNISIKEIISQLPETSGGIFLINRVRRQFVLTASAGFTQKETVYLERYPLERNIVSQTVDLGEPMLTGEFKFVDTTGEKVESRFKSGLVLPFVSGTEKIGGIILLSEHANHFSRSDINYLAPVAEWLAEKIKSARLTRENANAVKEIEKTKQLQNELFSRFTSVTQKLDKSDSLSSFCQGLTGFAESKSVHIFGIVNGQFKVIDGNEPLLSFSENYKTALVDALDKNKPIIINQESTTEDGQRFITLSSLVFPVAKGNNKYAILLRKESSIFKVADNELQFLELFSRIAILILIQQDSTRLDITRRKGFEQIIQLLRFKDLEQYESDPGYLIEHLTGFLPQKSSVVAFVKQSDGSFKPFDGYKYNQEAISDLHIYPGEGTVGISAATVRPAFVQGKAKVGKALESYELNNKDKILKLFGERGLPSFMATCPVCRTGNVIGVVKVFIYDLTLDELPELERLITLAVDLYSIGLTIDFLYHQQAASSFKEEPDDFGLAINQLNNHLSAVIGNAELAQSRDDISGEVKNQFRSILTEAESAARFLKRTLGQISSEKKLLLDEEKKSFGSIILRTLNRSHISDNLFMIGGVPREVNITSDSKSNLDFSPEQIEKIFEEAVNRFASTASEEDIITINNYEKDNYLFLDISRHRKNFPPVEEVSSFGKYSLPEEVLKFRPSDSFLNYLDDSCFYSYDRYSQSPSYLSFKFPLMKSQQIAGSHQSDKIKILAIDDQPVIIELLKAMCQSLGYEITTALSGEEGIKLAGETKFDLILTDLAMPGMSGLETARKIIQIHKKIPIILLTGWEVKVDEADLEASGITKVLYKPFRIEQLTDLIKSAVSNRSFS